VLIAVATGVLRDFTFGHLVVGLDGEGLWDATT
jgi:hypothetical protein